MAQDFPLTLFAACRGRWGALYRWFGRWRSYSSLRSHPRTRVLHRMALPTPACSCRPSESARPPGQLSAATRRVRGWATYADGAPRYAASPGYRRPLLPSVPIQYVLRERLCRALSSFMGQRPGVVRCSCGWTPGPRAPGYEPAHGQVHRRRVLGERSFGSRRRVTAARPRWSGAAVDLSDRLRTVPRSDCSSLQTTGRRTGWCCIRCCIASSLDGGCPAGRRALVGVDLRSRVAVAVALLIPSHRGRRRQHAVGAVRLRNRAAIPREGMESRDPAELELTRANLDHLGELRSLPTDRAGTAHDAVGSRECCEDADRYGPSHWWGADTCRTRCTRSRVVAETGQTGRCLRDGGGAGHPPHDALASDREGEEAGLHSRRRAASGRRKHLLGAPSPGGLAAGRHRRRSPSRNRLAGRCRRPPAPCQSKCTSPTYVREIRGMRSLTVPLIVPCPCRSA
jgi:hypothetical protein